MATALRPWRLLSGVIAASALGCVPHVQDQAGAAPPVAAAAAPAPEQTAEASASSEPWPVRVIANTTSPHGRYAAAWGFADGRSAWQVTNTAESPFDDTGVENYLIDLQTAAILGKLRGEHFETDDFALNHSDVSIRWSQDESHFVHVVEGKFSAEVSDHYVLRGGQLSAPLDLSPHVAEHVFAHLEACAHPGWAEFGNRYHLRHVIDKIDVPHDAALIRMNVSGSTGSESDDPIEYFDVELELTVAGPERGRAALPARITRNASGC